MSINAISAALSGTPAASSVQGATAAQRNGATTAAQPLDFADLLGQMVTGAAGAVRTAESAAISGLRGQLPVAQVVQTVMAAQETLQTAVAVRDKVVSAYLEVSRMAI
jgi:flagellar hook-basal body complex protein FliE